MHAGAGTEHEAVHAGGDVALDQLLEAGVVDLALGIERGGDGQVDAGELECRHR
ncbi:hypothetical protein D3C79_1002350 [compost metagenome]